MNSQKLILGIYSQKPLGTHREDFEYALHHCYKPLLTFLYAKEDIHFVLYFSAAIYEWLENHYPEINMLIHDMVKRKQVELLAGGFYDPILKILPLKDRSRQVEKSITYLRKRFGKRPRSFWVTDQVWSPGLVTTLENCGIKNIIIATNSLVNEYTQKDTDRPFIMQEMGKTVAMFPVHGKASEIILKKGSSWIDELKKSVSDSAEIQTVMLDVNALISNFILEKEGELIGLLEQIFNDIERSPYKTSLPLLESVFEFSKFPKAYLQSGTYRANGLPKEMNKYNDMFIHYPEMNFLYGRLCYSQTLERTIKKEKSLKKAVTLEILRGESYGAFTQSNWGGIYQNYLRKENYKHLIEAEKNAREKGLFSSSITSFDFDFDGLDEYIYRGKNITAIVDQKGGSLAELDYLVTSWNYIDTFVGRPIESTPSAQKVRHMRTKQNCFLDILLDQKYELSKYEKFKNRSVVSFEQHKYQIEKIDKINKSITFQHVLNIPQTSNTTCQLQKTFSLRTNSIEVAYEIKNTAKRKISARFGSEQNISFAYDGDDFLEMSSVDSKHIRKIGDGKIIMYNVKKIVIRDNFKKTMLTLSSDKRFTLYKNVYATQMNTLFGEEEIYQYSILMPVWDISIEPNHEWFAKMEIRIEKIK